MQLEELQPSAAVRGITPDGIVTVVSLKWFGSEALELIYKTSDGKLASELLYRHDEPRLELAELGRPWSFDGDGALYFLVRGAAAELLLRRHFCAFLARVALAHEGPGGYDEDDEDKCQEKIVHSMVSVVSRIAPRSCPAFFPRVHAGAT